MFGDWAATCKQHFTGFGLFGLNLSKECLHAKVIALTPSIVRMVMTFSTLDAYTKKNLTYSTGSLVRRRNRFVEHSGRRLPQWPFCNKHFPRKLIKWLIFLEALANPVVVQIGIFVTQC